MIIRHAIADCLGTVKERQNVFAVRFSTGSLCYFQASSENSMKEWVECINFMAAMFSAPPLPLPVGSSKLEFTIPSMPVAITRFHGEDQRTFIKSKITTVQSELDAHLAKMSHGVHAKTLPASSLNIHGGIAHPCVPTHTSPHTGEDRKYTTITVDSIHGIFAMVKSEILPENTKPLHHSTSQSHLTGSAASFLMAPLFNTSMASSKDIANWEMKRDFLTWELYKYKVYEKSMQDSPFGRRYGLSAFNCTRGQDELYHSESTRIENDFKKVRNNSTVSFAHDENINSLAKLHMNIESNKISVSSNIDGIDSHARTNCNTGDALLSANEDDSAFLHHSSTMIHKSDMELLTKNAESDDHEKKTT